MLAILPIVIAYLLGTIPFGLLVSRLFGVSDIRSHGSGNTGATNVGRVLGYKAAIWVYIGDIAKGLAAVFIARYFFEQYQLSIMLSEDGFLLLCVLAAVLGHIFPIFLGFHGGKGVNTALGGMIALLPLEVLFSLLLFGIVVVVTKYISLGSIVAAMSLFLIVAGEKFVWECDIAMIYVWVTGVIGLLILITHHQNIMRLIAGTENKIMQSSQHRKGTPNV